MLIITAILVAYAVFFCVTISAIAAGLEPFSVPLGCVAAVVVLLAAFGELMNRYNDNKL